MKKVILGISLLATLVLAGCANERIFLPRDTEDSNQDIFMVEPNEKHTFDTKSEIDTENMIFSTEDFMVEFHQPDRFFYDTEDDDIVYVGLPVVINNNSNDTYVDSDEILKNFVFFAVEPQVANEVPFSLIIDTEDIDEMLRTVQDREDFLEISAQQGLIEPLNEMKQYKFFKVNKDTDVLESYAVVEGVPSDTFKFDLKDIPEQV